MNIFLCVLFYPRVKDDDDLQRIIKISFVFLPLSCLLKYKRQFKQKNLSNNNSHTMHSKHVKITLLKRKDEEKKRNLNERHMI